VFCCSQMKPTNVGSRNIEPGISCVPTTASDCGRAPRMRKRASAYPAQPASAVAAAAATVQMIALLTK
jgi:hypothetical protein